MLLRPLRSAPMMLGGVGFQAGLDQVERERAAALAPGDLWFNDLKAQAVPMGMTIVDEERFARPDTSVTGQVLKLVAANPDAILVGASGTAAALPQTELRERGYFLVDKTSFIADWWHSADQVTLICRPRRFGKTLNMDMVECFFSNKYALRTDLFNGLDVWNDVERRDLDHVVGRAHPDHGDPATGPGGAPGGPVARHPGTVLRADRAHVGGLSGPGSQGVPSCPCHASVCAAGRSMKRAGTLNAVYETT